MLLDGQLQDVRDIPAHEVGSGTVKRQVDPAGLAAIVREWRARFGVDAELAVLERVAARPGQGVASMFSLGHSLGACQGALAALGVPTVLVAPQTWKRQFALGKDKAQAQQRASETFPGHAGLWVKAKDHNRAEAALLGLYGWRDEA